MSVCQARSDASCDDILSKINLLKDTGADTDSKGGGAELPPPLHGMTVDRLIGRGAYGAVYAMANTRMAVKHISFGVSLSRACPSMLRSKYYLADCKRIVREMILHALVQRVYSDTLVPLRSVECLSVKEDDKWTLDVLLTMDRYDMDLSQYISTSPLPGTEMQRWESDMTIARSLIRAVLRLHFVKVMHRDLKPANVLLRTDANGLACEVVLCDMGMARQLTSDDRDTMLWTDYITTRWYRAPELCEDFNGSYGVACDAWSVGCILFQLATRRVLFAGSSAEMQVSSIEGIIGAVPEVFWRRFHVKSRGEQSSPFVRSEAVQKNSCSSDSPSPIHHLLKRYCPWPDDMRSELANMIDGLLDWIPETRVSTLRVVGRRFAMAASGNDAVSDEDMDKALYGSGWHGIQSMIVRDSKSLRMYEEMYLSREQACDLIQKTCKYVRMNIDSGGGGVTPKYAAQP